MSWNKNTINVSNLDAIKKTLDNLGVSYKLTLLGTVLGLGLNDEVLSLSPDEDKHYEIRRLEYANKVILERMLRSADCDSDDWLVSYEFNLCDEPRDWKIATKLDH